MLDPDFFRQVAPVAARVTQSTLAILAGALLGAELDKRYQTAPWGFLSGLAAGMMVGFLALLRGQLSSPEDDDDDDHPPHLP